MNLWHWQICGIFCSCKNCLLRIRYSFLCHAGLWHLDLHTLDLVTENGSRFQTLRCHIDVSQWKLFESLSGLSLTCRNYKKSWQAWCKIRALAIVDLQCIIHQESIDSKCSQIIQQCHFLHVTIRNCMQQRTKIPEINKSVTWMTFYVMQMPGRQ